MKFVDEVEIEVKGGDGGRPCVAFLREKYRPYGGPSGGDGGNGGSVILRADGGLSTLVDFQFPSRIHAGRGGPGRGKSTLVRAVSAARPKVADYPFTTLVPQLGVVGCGEGSSFVIADVPGLIPGAHRGEGLGDRFLRHLLRSRVLLHLIDLSGLSGRSPLADFDAINRELELFDPALAARPQVVVGNKLDLAESRANLPELTRP